MRAYARRGTAGAPLPFDPVARRPLGVTWRPRPRGARRCPQAGGAAARRPCPAVRSPRAPRARPEQGGRRGPLLSSGLPARPGPRCAQPTACARARGAEPGPVGTSGLPRASWAAPGGATVGCLRGGQRPDPTPHFRSGVAHHPPSVPPTHGADRAGPPAAFGSPSVRPTRASPLASRRSRRRPGPGAPRGVHSRRGGR